MSRKEYVNTTDPTKEPIALRSSKVPTRPAKNLVSTTDAVSENATKHTRSRNLFHERFWIKQLNNKLNSVMGLTLGGGVLRSTHWGKTIARVRIEVVIAIFLALNVTISHTDGSA